MAGMFAHVTSRGAALRQMIHSVDHGIKSDLHSPRAQDPRAGGAEARPSIVVRRLESHNHLGGFRPNQQKEIAQQ
jgi:hypothetical protein